MYKCRDRFPNGPFGERTPHKKGDRLIFFNYPYKKVTVPFFVHPCKKVTVPFF